jgi:uncharacterized protein (DUF952 family)
MVLGNFFVGRQDLYLLQIDAAKVPDHAVVSSSVFWIKVI